MTRPTPDGLPREILATAQRLFGAIGFRAASLQMIADEVGCSKAALLYHFHTKAAILDALVTGLRDDLEQVVTQLRDVPADEQVARALDLSVRLIVRHRDALAALRGLDDLAEISAVIAQSQRLAEDARRILTGPEPDARRLVAVLTVEHGLLAACLALPNLPDEELAAALRDVGARILQVESPDGPAAP